MSPNKSLILMLLIGWQFLLTASGKGFAFSRGKFELYYGLLDEI